MENKLQNSFLIDFANKHYEKIRTFEKISIVIFVIGLILTVLKIQNVKFILIVGSVFLAICYFLLAYKLLSINESEATGILNSNGWANFTFKLTYFALAVTSLVMIDLVFRFNKGTLIIVAVMTLSMALLSVLLTKRDDKHEVYPINFILRIIIAITLLIYVIIERGTIF